MFPWLSNNKPRKFIEEGFESSLKRCATQLIYERKTDGNFETKLVTLFCSTPSKGFARWSLRLLANKRIELNYVENVSPLTVGNILKNELKPWKIKRWTIPSEKNGAFEANMERVLNVYKRPYDRDFPMVCIG